MGLVWWWARWPKDAPADWGPRAGRELALDLGLEGAPKETTVEAGLVTGRSPGAAFGGRHRRGGLDPAACAWVREHSRLRAWNGGAPVRCRTGWPPEAFRRPPTVAMCAAPHAPATFGDVRRGQAVPPDLWGERYRARGHSGLPPLPMEELAAQVGAWAAQDRVTLLWTDSGAPSAWIPAILERISGVFWVLVALRSQGEGVRGWLWASSPIPETIQRVEEVSLWIDQWLEGSGSR
ncbi:MAG: hypothetical protein K6U14_11290 [Firmicutes bacterium]|nr:hypothetical protein [Alicyclobacillaceae bacterium]MCL6498197.1 hypothetical protein [Bacillota bacterium]